MTLMELMTAISIGMVVLLGHVRAARRARVRMNTDVMSKTDAMQRGRLAMDVITQELRSQVCLDEPRRPRRSSPASPRPNTVTFYSDFSEGDGTRRADEAQADVRPRHRQRHDLGLPRGRRELEPRPGDFPAAPARDPDAARERGPPARQRKTAEIPFLRYYAYEWVEVDGGTTRPEATLELPHAARRQRGRAASPASTSPSSPSPTGADDRKKGVEPDRPDHGPPLRPEPRQVGSREPVPPRSEMHMSRRLHLSAEHGYTMAAVMLIMLATSILAAARSRPSAPTSRSRAPRRTASRRTRPPRPASSTTCTSSRATTTTGRTATTSRTRATASRARSTTRTRAPTARWRTLVEHARRSSRSSCCPRQRRDECVDGRPRTTMLDENTGTFRIRSTGVSRGVKRSIVTTLRRTSFLDYLYFTDYEASDPNSFASTAGPEHRAHLLRASTARDPQPDHVVPRQRQHHVPGLGRDPRPAAHQRRPADLRLARLRAAGEEDVIEVHGPAPGGYSRSGNAGCSGAPDFNGPVRQPAEHLPVPTSNTRAQGRPPTRPTCSPARPRSRSTARRTWTRAHVPGRRRHRSRRTWRCRRTASSTSKRTARARSQAAAPDRLRRRRRVALRDPRRPRHLPEVDDARLRGRHPDRRQPRWPARASPVLGLIAKRFVRVKHDVQRRLRREQHQQHYGTEHRVRTNYTIEAAILALKDSFVVDN